MKQRREDREQLRAVTRLAEETSVQLNELKELHLKDECEFRESLRSYIEESRNDRSALHDEMSRFADNRVNDRKQSIEIQKELRDSISETDERIEALMLANKEMLAEKINEKYKCYISLGGIPADEYDEFVSMHSAYNGLGGNHHGDAKFEYCMEHLPVIPVETKLVYKH
jgi:vacuolar-type H+-ATPase subunit I/STV1